jgi:hypothetical protein
MLGCKLAPWSCALIRGIFVNYTNSDMFLTKTARKRKIATPRRDGRSHDDEHPEEGDADEATALIAETTAELVRLARRHRLDMLDFLLRMAHLEAEERLRLRSRRKLS